MKKNAFKYLIVSVLSLIGLNQNASAYGDKIYYDEAGIPLMKANEILIKNNHCKDDIDRNRKVLSSWTNTKTGGIVGIFYTIIDQKTINEIIEVYTRFFYENNQKFDVVVSFYRKPRTEVGVFFQDEPFVQLKLKRIEK